MRLICPNCVAQYEVDDNVIPPEGRDVQCANCGHNWFQDSIQMFTHHQETPVGLGDPDSDVPPELFNDLEGRLDTSFGTTPAQTAPGPNDMEPEEAQNDFQIEQEPEAPSSRLDQDVLDVLRSEAEYSSGEKPPAAVETNPEISNETNIADDLQDILEETQRHEPQSVEEATPIATELAPEPEPAATASESSDDLDEIRRRIMELEAQEERIDPAVEEIAKAVQEPEVIQKTSEDAIEELSIDDITEQESDSAPEPFSVEYAEPQNSSSPFTRPSASGARTAPPEDTSVPVGERVYEENIPYEEPMPSTPSSNQEVDIAIEALVAEQSDAQTAPERPRSKVAARAFPNAEATNDELYGASQDRVEARKDLFPDVDELSNEIASEAENNGRDATVSKKPKVKSKGSFLKGFKYALLLCIIIGILYMLQPVIVEYVPQAEGFLNIVAQLVDQVAELIRTIAAQIQGLIG